MFFCAFWIENHRLVIRDDDTWPTRFTDHIGPLPGTSPGNLGHALGQSEKVGNTADRQIKVTQSKTGYRIRYIAQGDVFIHYRYKAIANQF